MNISISPKICSLESLGISINDRILGLLLLQHNLVKRFSTALSGTKLKFTVSFGSMIGILFWQNHLSTVFAVTIAIS